MVKSYMERIRTNLYFFKTSDDWKKSRNKDKEISNPECCSKKFFRRKIYFNISSVFY